MQRVVALFVGILSVVRATPFNLDSVDRPTPFRYTFRVEKVEFGNDAISEDSEYEDDYNIGTFESDENDNFNDESDGSKSMKALEDLFRDVQFCDILDLQKPLKDGCIYVANGNVYFFGVLSKVDVEDVYKAFEDAGIEECEVGEDGFNIVPEDGCFRINEDIETVFLNGVYDDDMFFEAYKIADIKEIFNYIEKCDLTVTEIPKEGCALLDQNGVHIINFLNDHNIDDVESAMSKLNITKCMFDEELGFINKDPCYFIKDGNFHILNLHVIPEGVQDVDDDDSEETYEIPDSEEVSPPYSIQTVTGNGNLQQLKLKGLFNQRSSIAKKAKDVVQKKIQSRKQPQKKLEHRGLQNGRNGYTEEKVKHRPN